MKQKQAKSRWEKFGLWAGAAFVCGVFLLAGLFLVISTGLPSVRDINAKQVDESTKIYDREGKVMLYEIHGGQKRTVVPFADIPEYVKQATLSIEDKDFYSNPAFDWKGIARAIWIDITRGRILQGGSTITQQLAKNAFLSPERTIIRKLRELVLAWRLEKYYTKDQILELYLNQVPYGGNSYGIEEAAQLYFGKSVKDVTLNEAAMLASLTKAPTYYSPWGKHYDELVKRKNLVLTKMAELGYISETKAKTAQKEKLTIVSQSSSGMKAPHFVMHVADYLNRKYGKEFVEKAGLKVITTLDWELEQYAEEAVARGAKRNTELYQGKNAALVAQDPKTGQILAMVGSADFFDYPNEGNFNVATQGLRQPGSTFKPFVYLSAFLKGFTPDTILWDVPTNFDTTNDPERSYTPANFDEKFIGPVSMKEALAQSRNVPAVETLYLAGVNDTMKLAAKFGITTLKDKERFGLSLVLGGGEVKLSELVGAYSVFATEGVKHAATPILRIIDRKGNVLEEYADQSEQVIEANYARIINDILSDIELRTPLFSSNIAMTRVPGYQVALKTGTTNNYVDAWTMGFTPNLVAGVWVGNNHREPLQKRGGSILAALPIWHDFFSKAVKKFEPETFTAPEPLTSDIPIVRGELPPGESHSVLHYLGRTQDSQYQNWESAISKWVAANFNPNPAPPQQQASLMQTLPGEISINIASPQNGEVITGPINVSAQIKSTNPLARVDVYLNGALIDQRVGNFGNDYFYTNSFAPSQLNSQNLLEIHASDMNGLQAQRSLIIFHN